MTNFKRQLPALVAASVAFGTLGAFADEALADSGFYCDKDYSVGEVCRRDQPNPSYTDVSTTTSVGRNGTTGTHCNNAYAYYYGQKTNPYDACGYTTASAQSTYTSNTTNVRNPMIAVYSNQNYEGYKGSWINF